MCPKAKFSQDAGRRLAAVDPILRAATRRASGCGFGRVTGCIVSKQLIVYLLGWVHGRQQVANHDIRVEEVCRGNGWMVGKRRIAASEDTPFCFCFFRRDWPAWRYRGRRRRGNLECVRQMAWPRLD